VRGWFGPFRIERQVGRGGLGAVYRAIDSRSGDTVALKLLPPGSDSIALARLEREFRALRALQHPNIVRVLELGEEDGIPWLSMEFVEGLVLRDFLTVVGDPVPLEPDAGYPEGVDLDVLFDEPDSGALLAAARCRQFSFRTDLDAVLTDLEQEELDRAQRLAALCESLAQICDGLHFIHARGLVHRDLKPSNILVNTAHRAILVDFGLVKRMQDDRVTDAGRTVGTYRYMSPEQARGEKVDRKADRYSVGATLYDRGPEAACRVAGQSGRSERAVRTVRSAHVQAPGGPARVGGGGGDGIAVRGVGAIAGVVSATCSVAGCRPDRGFRLPAPRRREPRDACRKK